MTYMPINDKGDTVRDSPMELTGAMVVNHGLSSVAAFIVLLEHEYSHHLCKNSLWLLLHNG